MVRACDGPAHSQKRFRRLSCAMYYPSKRRFRQVFFSVAEIGIFVRITQFFACPITEDLSCPPVIHRKLALIWHFGPISQNCHGNFVKDSSFLSIPGS